MSDKSIKPFTVHVKEIFRFGDGSTVFVGEVLDGGKVITPCRVTVLVDGAPIASLELEGERMPGPKLPPGYRIVYTRKPINFDLSIDPTRYTLAYSSMP